MKLQFSDELIPGTRLKKSEMENLTGLAFLQKVFFVSKGVMLTPIRFIAGIDSSTLQNWTKRGLVPTSYLKKYNIDQLAHILIINMLRSCMQLDHIAFLIRYINNDIEDTSDDIVSESVLYDYICKILEEMLKKDTCALDSVKEVVMKVTKDYREPVKGAKERLTDALEVIVVSYYSALIKRRADQLWEKLSGQEAQN